MFLPFSKTAKEWEKVAVELRGLAQVHLNQLLDPWSLAKRVGLTVLDDEVSLSALSGGDRKHLTNDRGTKWSGGVYPVALPDGTFLCILNPSHSRRRNKITLMEEIVHTHLGHRPTSVIVSNNGVRVRDYDERQEKEAYGIGAAALIPWATFFHLLNSGTAVEALAEEYDVTPELIQYRIKITAAHKLYIARQRLYT